MIAEPTSITMPGARATLAELATAALVEVARTAGLAPELFEGLAADERVQWRRELEVEAPVAPGDLTQASLGVVLRLSNVEQLSIALLLVVERNAAVARLVMALQAPLPGGRPTVGLLAATFADASSIPGTAYYDLVDGPARAAGALVLRGDDLPLVERPVALSAPLHAVLRGLAEPPPGVSLAAGPPVVLPPSVLARAVEHAAAFRAGEQDLVVRSPSLAEGRAVCAAIAAAARGQAVFVDGEPVVGFGLWLVLSGAIPVFTYELAPGDRRRLPRLPGYDGPVLVLAGLEGAIDRDGVAVPAWCPGVPGATERAALWHAGLGDPELAAVLAAGHRHGAGRIAQLSRAARRAARLDGAAAVTIGHVRAALWTSEGSGLRGLAEPMNDDIPDRALVTSPPLRRDLELLLLRCREREAGIDDLGAALRARHRPGVRALFVGPSGTGKTFAAGWLASRLGAPLYRVDLAAVTSKYIGETEKNLAQLLAQAEHEEVVLLFDEADAMFGKRTDVKDSNDRFANAQTNFLLQRIESFDGIIVLTTNSRTRIDAAFTRRLDAVVDFPPPGPEERRALWRAHLGAEHALDVVDFNRLAAACDLSGGHVRNAVLCASLLARRDRRPIRLTDLVAGLGVEYRKLGRTVPAELGEATAIVAGEGAP